ncbi:MAG: NAD-dependent epimerase/dehydratase family protein [Asgard group archaeon]|nr:NAD-dependent epimerase/dehydratase family protein [Asgard group archaeon]
MTNFMITGGAGFIGYHLSKYILEKGHKVVIYDNFADYYSPELKWMNAQECQNEGAKIVVGDILDKKLLAKTLSEEGIDRVIHLAGQPGVRYSTINPDSSIRVNTEGTSNILTVSRECNVSRVVVSSSSSVYGQAMYLPINEAHPKTPISFYGVSKLAAEQLADVSRYLFPDFDTVVVRPFTVVGSRQRPDMAINKFVRWALTKTPITVFGDGNQTRDWTHVRNMAQGFYLAATHPKAKNQNFNCGAGTRISVNKVLDVVSEVTGQDLIIEHVIMNKADVKDTFADISKAKYSLGYDPKQTIFDAIEEFTQFFMETNLTKDGNLLPQSKLIRSMN